MITAGDKAKRNYERVKRWREKHRALLNLRRRQAYLRKKNLSGGSDRRAGEENHGRSQEPASPPAQTSKDETLEKLRGLIKVEQEKPAVEVPVKPKMVRTETGMLVPDEVWQEREEYKRRSREKGFEPDQYAQA